MCLNILIISALCLLSVIAETQLLSCTAMSTGTCNTVGGGCNLPSNANNCTAIWQGISYLCTNPPSGYYYVGVTCNYMISCTTCSASAFNNPQPICQWRT